MTRYLFSYFFYGSGMVSTSIPAMFLLLGL